VRRGDRVVVINEDNEFLDCAGLITNLTKDGRLVVDLDFTIWEVPFDAHDLELEDMVRPRD
jgi:hypothetical protein